MKRKPKKNKPELVSLEGYDEVLVGLVELLESSRRTSARAVNAVMTATYWEIGRRIVECEQSGSDRASYGAALIRRLSEDLNDRFRRGFSTTNLKQFNKFYLIYDEFRKGQTLSDLFSSESDAENPRASAEKSEIRQTLSAESRIAQTPSAQLKNKGKGQTASDQSQSDSIFQTASGKFDLTQIASRFPLPWSHYVKLLKVAKPEAREFYETEALRGGWSVRQLDRQISTIFYERTLASRNKKSMLEKGSVAQADDLLTAEQEIKDPLVLEFLGLKDEYSESDLENALIEQLEAFLLELGDDFTFVGRQRRLRIEDEWYRIDLLFFHRALRCLVIIDLKIGKFTHADVGQMLLYLGYAAEHWTRPEENPPVGLVLCAQHNHSIAHYTLDRLPDQVLAAEYRLALPDEATLAAELERTQAALEQQGLTIPKNAEAPEKQPSLQRKRKQRSRPKPSARGPRNES